MTHRHLFCLRRIGFSLCLRRILGVGVDVRFGEARMRSLDLLMGRRLGCACQHGQAHQQFSCGDFYDSWTAVLCLHMFAYIHVSFVEVCVLGIWNLTL